MEDTCVCCGALVPEGNHVCYSCGRSDEQTDTITTNGDRLRAMSDADMAKWITYSAGSVIKPTSESYHKLLRWLGRRCDVV